jgi:hypothetical protein
VPGGSRPRAPRRDLPAKLFAQVLVAIAAFLVAKNAAAAV